jgi:hypothetical protein
MSFVFRLRMRMKCRIDPATLTSAIAIDGFPPIEIAHEDSARQSCLVDESQHCPSSANARVGGDRYTFIARGFADEASALASGRKFADLALAAGVTRHMGVDVGFDRPSLQFGRQFKENIEKATGKELRGDKIGLMTYQDGAVDIVRMEGALSTQTPLALFRGEMERWSGVVEWMTERQRTCAALLNDSHYAVQEEAQFVLLISAVEALCDQHALSPDYVEAVRNLEAHLATLQLGDTVRATLARTLDHAKRQSLRQSYMQKLRALLDDARARAFDDLYQLRSAFVHDGKGRGDLRSHIGKAREIGAALFEADLQVSAQGAIA